MNMTYNDLIDKVYYKEYDGIVADLSITADRSLYVDFTLPFTDIGVGTLVRTEEKSMWIFLDPLSADLWITSCCFFLFLGFVVWFIEHRMNKEFQCLARKQIGTALWFAFSTLVYTHREKLQSNLSRFVVMVWVFVVLVLTSSYTATLSLLLTIQQIASKGGSVAFQSLSPVGGAIFNNLKYANGKFERLYTPEDYAEALISSRVGAIVDEITYVKSVLSMYPAADFSLISTAPTTNGFGFAFQKGSPLVGEMSAEIARMREDGTLKMLENKWLKVQSEEDAFSSSSPKILNLYGFRGLFLISGVSMMFALMASIACLIREKWHIRTKIRIGRQRSTEIHLEPEV